MVFNLLNSRRTLIAIGILLAIFGHVQDALAQQDEQELVAFGNWRITYYSSNKAFNLKAATTGGRPGTFTFQCHPKDEYALQIPLWDLTNSKIEVAKVITVWSDNHKPIDINFPIYKGFLAIGVSSDAESKIKIENFIEVLGSAKIFFAMSYNSKTLEFDATHLVAARERFFALCKMAPRP